MLSVWLWWKKRQVYRANISLSQTKLPLTYQVRGWRYDTWLASLHTKHKQTGFFLLVNCKFMLNSYANKLIKFKGNHQNRKIGKFISEYYKI